MSKMSDMAMTIEELRSAAAAINEAANWLAEQFGDTADGAPVEKPAAKEEKEPDLKLENVRAVLAEKSRAGQTAGSTARLPQGSARHTRIKAAIMLRKALMLMSFVSTS